MVEQKSENRSGVIHAVVTQILALGDIRPDHLDD
jgi:hypothetical protein